MNSDVTKQVQECADLSNAGMIHFGEVVQRMIQAGVERYHADYSRGETTYYWPTGESLTVTIPHAKHAIAASFSAKGIEECIRRAQRGEIRYPEFVKESSAVGCVGYFAQITGRKVIYFGRDGDQHVEPFPATK